MTRQDRDVIDALGKVAACIAAGASRDIVLTLITGFTRKLVDCDLAAVTVPYSGGGVVTLAADGAEAHLYRGRRFPDEASNTSKVMETGVAVIVDNLSGNRTVSRHTPGRPLGPSMFIPIAVDGPYGSLSASRYVGGEPFTEQEVDLVRCFAAHASLVLEQDAHRQRNAHASRVNEQLRLAEDLQTLAVDEIFSASVLLSGVTCEIGDGTTRDRVVHAIDQLDHATKLIRQIAFGLVERTRSA